MAASGARKAKPSSPQAGLRNARTCFRAFFPLLRGSSDGSGECDPGVFGASLSWLGCVLTLGGFSACSSAFESRVALLPVGFVYASGGSVAASCERSESGRNDRPFELPYCRTHMAEHDPVVGGRSNLKRHRTTLDRARPVLHVFGQHRQTPANFQARSTSIGRHRPSSGRVRPIRERLRPSWPVNFVRCRPKLGGVQPMSGRL